MWYLYLTTVIPRIIPFTFGESPIFAGEAAQVTCLVSAGDPPLDISWHFEGISDIGITVTKVGRKASTLLIESAGIQHRGNYTCIAKNTAGFVNYTTPLNIHGNLQLPITPFIHNLHTFIKLFAVILILSLLYNLNFLSDWYSFYFYFHILSVNSFSLF